MKPRLKYNCPEKWEGMKIGLLSRYCENCQKEVHDFTKMSRDEILLHLLKNRTEQICGRVLKSQLDYSHQDVLITIESYLEKNKNSNLAFYLLAIGALTLLSCSTDKTRTGSHQMVTADSLHIVVTDTNTIENTEGEITSSDTNEIVIIDDTIYEILLGEICIIPDSTVNQTTPLLFADVMPEFVGGIDSLFSFLEQNLVYPEWELENNIQGTVYVSFTVTEKGEVIDPKIVRTVTEAKDFDSEVIKIIEMMPNWVPGEQDGKKVAVQYHLPIKFKM